MSLSSMLSNLITKKNTILAFISVFLCVFFYLSFTNPIYKNTKIIIFPTENNTNVNRIYTNTHYGYMKPSKYEQWSDVEQDPLLGLDINQYFHFKIQNIPSKTNILVFNQHNKQISSANIIYNLNDVFINDKPSEILELPTDATYVIVNNTKYLLKQHPKQFTFAILVFKERNNTTSIYISNISSIILPDTLTKYEIASTTPIIVAFSKSNKFIIEASVPHINYPKTDLSVIDKKDYDNKEFDIENRYLDVKYPALARYHLANFDINYEFFSWKNHLTLLISFISLFLSLSFILFWKNITQIKLWLTELNLENKIFLIILFIFWATLSFYWQNSFTAWDRVQADIVFLNNNRWFGATYFTLEYISNILGYISRTMLVAGVYVYTLWFYKKILERFVSKKLIIYIALIPLLASPVILLTILNTQRAHVSTIFLICGIIVFFYNYLLNNNQVNKYIFMSYFALLFASMLRQDYIFYLLAFISLLWIKNTTYKNFFIMASLALFSFSISAYSQISYIPTLLLLLTPIIFLNHIKLSYYIQEKKSKITKKSLFIIATLCSCCFILSFMLLNNKSIMLTYQNTQYCRIIIPFIHDHIEDYNEDEINTIKQYVHAIDKKDIINKIAYVMGAIKNGYNTHCTAETYIADAKHASKIKSIITKQIIKHPYTFIKYRNLLFVKSLKTQPNRVGITYLLHQQRYDILFTRIFHNKVAPLKSYLDLRPSFIINLLYFITSIIIIISSLFIKIAPASALLSIAFSTRTLFIYLTAPATYMIYKLDLMILSHFIFIFLLGCEIIYHKEKKE